MTTLVLCKTWVGCRKVGGYEASSQLLDLVQAGVIIQSAEGGAEWPFSFCPEQDNKARTYTAAAALIEISIEI